MNIRVQLSIFYGGLLNDTLTQKGQFVPTAGGRETGWLSRLRMANEIQFIITLRYTR